ncbi:tail fiber protein and host specificity [Streptococcus phage 2972]|uniref:Antireceptor n=1 Tax=Streptococcus phage 2972 TaxID=2908019 RepID=Q56S86_9CAUD|nr:tail fiber protein and host specificity [Streptococcus phage 2972]AAW27942.1 antireceptor [Streptococcus phage 2972]
MLLTIHDANLQKIGFIDNEKQETLNFYNDTWTRNLETASSTFEFTVSKKQLLSDTGNKHLYNQLNERSFVSFKYKGKTYLFNIMKTEENERWLRCYCENLNLELINEYTNAYKADRPRSFAEYLDVFEIPQFAMVKIGVNEISDQKRTLEWEGQETKLARLLSLANKFDAEVEFVTQLNDDSSIKQLVLNVYHKADDSHTGVGRIRGDIRLTFEKNIKSMTRKIDKTEVYTLVVPYGKSKETHEGEQEVRVYIDSLPPWEEKNDEGIVIFKQEGVNLYAPHAADLYPSTFGVSTQSNKWIRKDLEVDSDNPSVIRAAGIANLRKHAYPAITYEVDGFVDVEIGDTITIHDKGFTPALDIRSRAVEQKISFSNPTNNKTTFGNFKELENRTSGDLRSVFEQMVENSRPYNILVSTDNGVMFKNNTGRSTISPTLKRGNQTVPATYRFVIDGSIVSSGLTYTVKASDISKPTVITISAWVDNKEVASEEVTFVNVSDGKQGPKGDRGNDGLPGKDGVGLKSTTITYGMSDSDTIMPTSWTANPPTLIKGKYLWTKTQWTYTDSTSETGYQKTYIAKDGNNGNDGLPGKDGVGIRNTTITYAQGTSGTVAPTNGWSTQVPNVPAGQYLWTKTVWDYTDNTSETGYSVAKMGEQGPRGDQGIPGPKGIDGTDAPTIFVKSYTYSAGSKAYIKLTGPNAFEQTLYYSRGHNVWVLDATTHKLKEFVHCDTYITMSFNHNGVNITLADYLNSITDSIVAIAAADADAVDQNFRDVLNKMGGNPELGTWSWRTGHVFIGMSKRSDGTWPLQPRQGYEVAIQEDGSAPEIGCTLSIGGIVANGADGKTQYTHIAYANSADGSKDFSTSDSNRAYIGMYVDFNINDSTNPSDYSWTLVKGADGTQGVPGKPGADGKTPYFHTAWAYSADGTDGFTTVYPNLNLLEGTATFDGMNPNSSDNSVSAITKTKISGIANTVMDVKTSGNAFAVGFYTQKGYNITAGQTITISFIAKASSDTSLFVGFEHFPSGHKMFTISTKWELYTYTFTATTSGTPTFVMYGWDMVAGQGFQLYNPKAELGSVATPWMPSASEVTTADYPSFIGQYTNYTQVDSPNPRDYTWSLIRGNDGKQGPQGPKGDRGIPGIKGADGRTQYTHIAYADTISGSGFSQTDVNKAYIGMYQDFNAEDSKNPQDYRWSKWKGSDGRDGIPGKAGADGRTPYVHFAYADSADGQKGFSLTQTGRKRYLGVLTNFFKEDSTNPSDYTWNDTAGSISVGGRNLLVKTNQGITNWNWQLSDGDKSVEEVKVDGIRAVKLIKGSTAANTGWNFIEYNGLLRELIQPKSKYVLSFDVKPSVDVTFYATLARGDFNEPLTDTVAMPKALANQWNKVSCVLTSKETLPNIAWQVVYLAGMPTTNGNWVIIKNIKLEEGDIPTQWTPAIEDIQDEIDSKADAAMTIEQINALNERAGIIKAEMEAKASAEILNNWIKNYQDFVKANETERAAAEKALVSSSQRVSTIAKELGELSDRWNFIDTYMNSSNDGLVIGKNDGSSSMMFNPNGRISMYSAGEEVMYISQGVIHIENGIFSKTIQVGRYREEQYHLNPDMNVIRYVGGF